jgi:hypothetical protein
MDSALFSDREKAALLWAEHVTKNTARSRDDIFETVKKSFSESEIVELTFLTAYFNMRNRLNDSLKMPIEEHSDVSKIKKTLNVNTDKVKQFLQHTLDNWPDSFPEPNRDD